MSREVLVTLALALCAAPLSAQNFNLDFGEPANQPPATYAAAAGPGYWNSIRAENGHDYPLRDLAGNATGVHVFTSGSAAPITSTDPSVTGDDALLMNDGTITYDSSFGSNFYVEGLAPGTYDLIVYAWRPDVPAQMAETFVDYTIGLYDTGGAWPGGHVQGITYARFTVTVFGNGEIGVHSGLAGSADPAIGAVCNGMQLRRIEEQTPFCFGDGSGSACPCGNSGAPGHGCENSSSTGGALLTSSGTTIPDELVLAATGEKPTALTIFLQGTASVAAVPYGDGLRCVSGSLRRLFVRNASGGAVSVPQGVDPSITARSSQLGDPIPVGATRFYMTYYRDPDASFCPGPSGGTFNASNCLSVHW
ncbi:MAG TPA: hypothetical protein VGR31_12605 [Planctomycetota bacterium]|jgi:hypothetical protein|nr:hypothetical protein [Planctomycetota bacterium]